MYTGIKNGKPYVGRTYESLLNRYTHEEIERWAIEPVREGLTYNQARGLEQHYIEENLKAAGGKWKRIANDRFGVSPSDTRKNIYRREAAKVLSGKGC